MAKNILTMDLAIDNGPFGHFLYFPPLSSKCDAHLHVKLSVRKDACLRHNDMTIKCRH